MRPSTRCVGGNGLAITPCPALGLSRAGAPRPSTKPKSRPRGGLGGAETVKCVLSHGTSMLNWLCELYARADRDSVSGGRHTEFSGKAIKVRSGEMRPVARTSTKPTAGSVMTARMAIATVRTLVGNRFLEAL